MKLNKLTIDYDLFKDKLNALNNEQQVLPILAIHQILKECEVKSKRGKNNDLINRVTELENELKLTKEQLYRLCGCLYPQALGKDDLEYIATGEQKGGAE